MAISWYNSRSQGLIEKDLVRIYKNNRKGRPVIIFSISRDMFRNHERAAIGLGGDSSKTKIYLKGDDAGYMIHEQSNRKIICISRKELVDKLIPLCGEYSISIDTEYGPNVFSLKEV
jgi:hypothetical protein